MKKILKFILCLLFTQAYATKANYDPFFKDYVRQSWMSEDGIPGNVITDIIQSDEGYIYFGTYSGLVRFDGVDFKIINHEENEKINFQSVRSLLQDKNGNIWVGSNEEGAYCLLKNGEVKKFTIKEGLTNNSVRAFCEDTEGNIWIGTASGISCISSDFQVINLEGFNNIPEKNSFIVSQLYCDTAGRIWIVTRAEKGLFLYSDKKFSVYNDFSIIQNPIVTAINQDKNGNFWFGISQYYAIKKVNEQEILYELSSGNQRGTVVSCIFQDNQNNIWFGLENGITILHDGILSFFDEENRQVEESITKIIEDREKNIWIATDKGGLEKLSYGKFQSTEVGTPVNAIAQDIFREVIWVAGDKGLFCYKNNGFQENKITKYFNNIRIRDVALDLDGNLLVSTYEKLGFVKIDLNGNIQTWTTNNGLAGNKVRVSKQISNGDIYVGTTTGLSIIKNNGNIRNITKNELIKNDYIMCIYETPEGEVWIGTDGGGIFVLKDEKVYKTISKKDGLVGNVIFKIDSLKENEIWVCTGSGATRIKDNQFFSYDNNNGFIGDGIFQLIPDYTRKVWGLCNRGIFYVSMQDFDDVIEGKKNNLNLKFYNRFDGVTCGNPTSTALSMKDNLGRIWFTLLNGFAIYDPIRNEKNSFVPEIKIEEVYADSEKIEIKENKVVLSPKIKRLKIKYTGISFISSGQIEFKTMLEGFDTNYSNWTNSREITYTNLQPGKYKLYIKAQNGDGVPTDDAVSIEIEKKPYFWQTIWFKIAIILLISAIIVFIYFIKINEYKKNQEAMEKLFVEVIQALVGTIDAKDKYTNGHSNRVAEYSKRLAKALDLSEDIQKRVYYSALLHDIGKIGISDTIINKPGELTKKEYEYIKEHPIIGGEILKSITIMPEIFIGARGHHERFDGNGYPDRLKGKEIPLIARIICVADAYDAMTSNRSYRKFMKQSIVRNELEKYKGTQFDPEIADKMLEIIDSDKQYELHE